MKTELQSLEGDAHDEVHQRKAMEALKRMESWNLFSDEHEVFPIPCQRLFVFCCFPVLVSVLIRNVTLALHRSSKITQLHEILSLHI